MEGDEVTSWLKGLLASLHAPGRPEASVALYFPEGDGWARIAVGGTDAEALFEAHLRNDIGPYGFVALEGEPLYLPDAEEEERVMECHLGSFAEVIAPVFSRSGSPDLHNAAGGSSGDSPGPVDQNAIGLLVARRRGPDSFKPDEVSGIIAWAKNFPG